MRNPGGYAVIVSPVPQRANLDGRRWVELGAGTFEADTFTCVHCNGTTHVPSKSQGDEYFCRTCMARICSPCADHPCIPFMKKIEEMEKKDYIRRQYAMLGA